MTTKKDANKSPALELIRLILLPLVIAGIGFFATIWTNSNQLKVTKLREVKELIAKLHAREEDPQFTRAAAAIALAEYGDLAVPALIASVLDGHSDIQKHAVRSLQRIGPRKLPELSTALLSDPNPVRRRNAAIALGLLKPEKSAQTIQQSLQAETEPHVRAAALVALIRVRGNARGLDASKIDLHGVDFRTANFDSGFVRTSLEGIDFSGANLVGVNFVRMVLKNVRFNDADARGANFQVADLADASFDAALLEGCDFKFADLAGVDFTGADFGSGSRRATTLKTILFSKNWQKAKFDPSVQSELSSLAF